MTAASPPPNASKPLSASGPIPGKKRQLSQDQTTNKVVTVRLTRLTHSAENPKLFKRETAVVSITRQPDKHYFLVKDGSKVKLVSAHKVSKQDSEEILAPASPERDISSDDDGSRVPGTPPDMQGRFI